MKKRLLFLPLLFSLLFTLVILMTPVKTVKADGNVCKIVRTGVEYDTLAKALAQTQDNDVVEFISDYTTPTTGSTVVDDRNVTIDFKNYVLTLSPNAYGGHQIYVYKDVTFKATTGGIYCDGTFKPIVYGDGGAAFDTDIVITIESGFYNYFDVKSKTTSSYTISSTSANYDYHNYAGRINVKGGKFYLNNITTRDHLISLMDGCDYFYYETSDCGDDGYGPKVLDVKSSTIVTSNDTKASLKYSFTQDDSYWVKITSPGQVEVGAQYMIGCFDINHGSNGNYTGYYMKTDKLQSYDYMDKQYCNTVTYTDGKYYIDFNENNYYTVNKNLAETHYYLEKPNGTKIGNNNTTGRLTTMGVTHNEFSIDSYGRIYMRISELNYFVSYRSTTTAGGYSFGLTSASNPTLVDPVSRSFGDNDTYFYAYLFKKVTPDPVVNNASLRFGQCISKDLYDQIQSAGTTVTFGVIAKKTADLGGAELTISNASMNRTITPVRVSAAGATSEDQEGDFYQFALVLSGITSSNFETSITARCYVCIDGKYYYFNPSEKSVKSIAGDYYNAVDTSSYTEFLPSLEVLKDYGG